MRMSLSSSCVHVATPSPPTPPEVPVASNEPAQAGGGILPTLMLAAVYALPIVVALRPVGVPVLDPDIWWHLRVGQWVSEHHTVPVTDPLSINGADKPWLAYSWLYEVLVYRLYETFGLAGIVAYRVVMSLAVVAALHWLVRRREPRFLVATGLTMTAAFAVAPLFSERPWLFTILFSTLTLDVLLDLRAGRTTRGVWLLPIIFALWANLHIQFVYGLLLLGLACLAPWMDALLARFPLTPNPSPPGGGEGSNNTPLSPARGRGVGGEGRILLLTAVCFAATLVNPYHVGLYGVVREYATQSGAFRCVNELRAMEFRETPDWVVLLLGAGAVFTLGRRRRLSSFEMLLLASTGILAFHARRDIWLLVLAALAILVNRKHESIKKDLIPSAFSNLYPCAGAAVLLTALIALLIWQRDLNESSLQRKAAGVFPVQAAAVIRERGYAGPLFNDFNWGGFLIWSLPQLPVVLDGRTNLHGDERILRIGNTWAAGPGWRDDPDLASAGVVVADAQSPLGCVLVLDDRFELVYEDATARVFVSTKLPRSGSHHR
jgi:hypothetical protein